MTGHLQQVHTILYVISDLTTTLPPTTTTPVQTTGETTEFVPETTRFFTRRTTQRYGLITPCKVAPSLASLVGSWFEIKILSKIKINLSSSNTFLVYESLILEYLWHESVPCCRYTGVGDNVGLSTPSAVKKSEADPLVLGLTVGIIVPLGEILFSGIYLSGAYCIRPLN